jgi:hypothetical protein
MALRSFTVLLLATSLVSRASGQQIEEYQLKAAFLYNFAKFVEWPSGVFKTLKDPIVLCVLGHNPFGYALEDVIRGKSIEGRALVFRQVADAQGANACQILFVASSEGKRFRTLAADLKPTGILTVGDAQGFATEGGVIDFKLDGGHVGFEINVNAAEHQQLNISSKLLGLAQIVKDERPR